MDPSRQRGWLIEAGVVVATAAWPLVLWYQHRAGEFAWPGRERLAVELLATVLALGALAWRHRHPTAVALVILPLSASAFAVVPAFVALFTVAVHRERRAVVAIAAGYLAAALAGAAVLDPPESWLPHVATIAAFHALPVTLGMVRASRLALLREYEDRARRAEAEQQLRVDQARRLERQRIAREMHDVVAHRLSLVSLHAGALTYRSNAFGQDVAEAAEVIRTSTHEALDELRGLIGVLREAPESAEPERPQPTLADVPALLDRCRAAGTRLTVHDTADGADSLPPAIGLAAYRVLEEGLTNAAKHAPDAPVAVTMDGRAGDRLLVEVANPLPLPLGAGRDRHRTIPGANAGLVGLVERVTLAGGRLEHGPTQDARFRLRAELPWRE
ncbi:sensor histidine kinase [Egibacter rhizosphaerae]|uniref:histidine kinase n=1 Tax=Egibacter rhizosphaerae TaxID=1670831 RepID=A0A411YEE7_9ACTN|nr:histidine kinase [Egibacter rhizosphaerae]QBI19589.1 sensor histidine kinase [Egibacter rhizosphaerae]